MHTLCRRTGRHRFQVTTSLSPFESAAQKRIETGLRAPPPGRIWAVGADNGSHGRECQNVRARIERLFGVITSERH